MKKNIKIFVSHRIDVDTEVVNSELFVPVRCGALFDKGDSPIMGDNTGDNISERRLSFCELTVHYWAWKNVDADYYGLCHYRRLFSFSDILFEETDDNNHVVEATFSDDLYNKYEINDESIRRKVESNDVVTIQPFDLKNIKHTKRNTIYESIKNNPTVFPVEAVDCFINIVKEKLPFLTDCVDQYFNGSVWRGFNCYIMKKELFFEYSENLFRVLFELEKKIDSTCYNQEQMRVIGYMGEAFWGIYFLYLTKYRNVKYAEQQLVKIEFPQKKVKIMPINLKNAIPIVIASSDEYTPFLSTLMQSIIDNASDAFGLDFIILTQDIKDDNKRILREHFQNDRVSIRFFDISSYIAGMNLHTSRHITVMTYLRLAIIDLLPCYDKVIYLDCDIIVEGDIAELYNTDMSNYMLAAVQDTVMASWINSAKYNKQLAKYEDYLVKELKLIKKDQYFNAGVLVVNIPEISKYYSSKQLFDIALEKKWEWYDQDVLNKIAYGKVKFLDSNWNVMAHFHDSIYTLTEFYAPYSVYTRYKSSLESPNAIHYAGRYLPCFEPYVDCAEYFWKYARKVPYYEKILYAMLRNENGKQFGQFRKNISVIYRLLGVFFPHRSKRRDLLIGIKRRIINHER